MNQHPAEQDSPRYRAEPTTSTSDCRLVDDAIDEYALGIADPSIQVAIERHALRCARCSKLIDTFETTVAALALAVPLVTPPASSKAAVMSRIAATPQTLAPPASVYVGDLDVWRTPTVPTSTSFTASTPEQPASSSPWWRVYAAPLATLPLLLALGLVSAWGFNTYVQLQDTQDALAMQSTNAADASDQTAQASDDSEVVELAFSSSAKRYQLTSATGAQSAVLVADPVTGKAGLQVEGLPAGTYQLLVQTQDGTMVQKAVFDVGDDGIATTAVDLGDTVADFQSVHIRKSSTITETDMAVDSADYTDVLMGLLGPDINQNSGTGIQGQ